jgi:phage shock protein PspC (stress-responsive transcriptional regulator)
MLAGVCSGLAREYNVHPMVVRIVVVGLTIFTGGFLGTALYIATALTVPEDGKDKSMAQQLMDKYVRPFR